jgi:hypothetical protein
MINRRAFLTLAAGAGGIAIGGATLFANGYESWIVGVLRRALPGYAFDPAGLEQFIADYRSRHAKVSKFRLLGAAETVFQARSLLRRKTADRIENDERKVLTEFLIGSDFFQHYPPEGRKITYHGRAVVCKSPFAVFDL